MLYDKLLRIISSVVPPSALLNMEALGNMDPQKIYVENVRSILRVPHSVAEKICDIAVRQGSFRRFVAVECPDGSEGAEAESEAGLPAVVTCYSDEGGFVHEVQVPASSLRKVTFYRLANG